MLLKARKIAFLGLLMAFQGILFFAGSIIEVNTLFFLAAASFCVGIAVRETGIWHGAGFLIGAVLMNFIIMPQKLYCFTMAGFGVYIFMVEYLQAKKVSKYFGKWNRYVTILAKLLVFNSMYLPTVVLAPQLVFEGQVNRNILVLMIVGGQAALFVFDKAYEVFMNKHWARLGNKIRK
ncbi:hypothetical protein SAMN05661086_00106 [Anaeromicropila populeti]|uniref:Energy-coupling factor transport system substrate-specific component n=2 Tax=Anaeromicropila populeti TaxID=37658 RepID=A0A1I6HMS3_9FIRM|nr:hypothetical protein SAMN05661086_00106 [Anaeromicropila populeti]